MNDLYDVYLAAPYLYERIYLTRTLQHGVASYLYDGIYMTRTLQHRIYMTYLFDAYLAAWRRFVVVCQQHPRPPPPATLHHLPLCHPPRPLRRHPTVRLFLFLSTLPHPCFLPPFFFYCPPFHPFHCPIVDVGVAVAVFTDECAQGSECFQQQRMKLRVVTGSRNTITRQERR